MERGSQQEPRSWRLIWSFGNLKRGLEFSKMDGLEMGSIIKIEPIFLINQSGKWTSVAVFISLIFLKLHIPIKSTHPSPDE